MDAPGLTVADTVDVIQRHYNHLHYALCYQFHGVAHGLEARYADPLRLIRCGYRVYSQNDEDGILDEIFRRIGTTSRTFVEFGVGDGMENNTLYRMLQGWRGAWIEADPKRAGQIAERFARFRHAGVLRCKNAFITAENIQKLFGELEVAEEFDLLSIDIDGNDYWVWQAIEQHLPRVVVIEYNAGFGPSAEWVMDYDPQHAWSGTRNVGASLKALELLGAEKGYRLVGCNLKGINAFCSRTWWAKF
ncbi:MAG: hypothetical protein H6816_14850 [Phycisphaerales bacterium]|nr:hypothetical protein [Phycisphaerales bacterium]